MTQDNKSIQVLQSHSLRELIESANVYGITKEDYVDIIKEEEFYILLYYK